MRAIILAGGKGTRLAPYTWSFPKPLIPLGEKPILDIIVRQLAEQGVERITMAIGHLGELIMAYFGDGEDFGIKIDYSKEDVPLGTAGPLSLIRELEGDFLVMNGDILTTINFRKLFDYHQKNNSMATIAMHSKSVKLELGVIHTDARHVVTDYIEKPALSYDVSMGIYVFNHSITRYIPENQRLDFPDLILTLIKQSEKVIAFHSEDYWVDIGTHAEYEHVLEEYEHVKDRLFKSIHKMAV